MKYIINMTVVEVLVGVIFGSSFWKEGMAGLGSACEVVRIRLYGEVERERIF